METKPTNMRLDEETKALIKLLVERLGVNNTAVVKQAIRVLARQEGVKAESK